MRSRTILASSFLIAACTSTAEQTSAGNNQSTAETSAIADDAIGYCHFSPTSMSFVGSPTEQALCLLTPVKRYAHLGERLSNLPSPLDQLMRGAITPPSRSTASNYLARMGLSPDSVGGPVSGRISQTREGRPAAYFVIHDTSSPYFGDKPFPHSIDADERINSFSGYDRDKAAHLFINRIGKTRLYHNFSVPWRATKLENKVVGVSSRGRFVHIELIQPRRRDPNGGSRNDAIAPEPGFSAPQYQKLAQAYVLASVRAERWLVPAYHVTVDSGLRDGHDDPQNFNLEVWANEIAKLLEAMR